MRITQAVLALPKLTQRFKKGPYKPDSFMKYARLSVLKDPSVWPLVTIVSGVGMLALAAMGWTAYSKVDVVFDKSHEPALNEVPLDRPTQKLLTINQTYKDIPEVHVMEEIEKDEH
ncbi:uncharacterized protein LOC118410892 [Branchiostoma floridae]|uniref:Uncharacterized protein LOC118410892 n=1 Tax=Branchiostoma floridae TaxID=7739 RepID=A0A9J7KRF0_BRAFL|nr:uncharacterized protein LOC118410892 [Branchiostoma floridae]